MINVMDNLSNPVSWIYEIANFVDEFDPRDYIGCDYCKKELCSYEDTMYLDYLQFYHIDCLLKKFMSEIKVSKKKSCVDCIYYEGSNNCPFFPSMDDLKACNHFKYKIW